MGTTTRNLYTYTGDTTGAGRTNNEDVTLDANLFESDNINITNAELGIPGGDAADRSAIFDFASGSYFADILHSQPLVRPGQLEDPYWGAALGACVLVITLAYLATGFDWNATYVGTLSPDGRSMALLGWMTLASGDDTTFADATTSAVAGKVSRDWETRDDTGRTALLAVGSSTGQCFECFTNRQRRNIANVVGAERVNN